MNIDILFPVLNEHLRLENGIRRTAEYLLSNREQFFGTVFSLLIVDNGSDDDTPEIAKRLVDEFGSRYEPYLRVGYKRIEERGVGIAFRTGVEETYSEIVGYMDIDLSTDLGYLREVVRIFEEDPATDYINASRFSKESDVSGRKWYRKITSKGLLVILKLVFGMKATDAICGFTFVRRTCAERLVRECGNDKGWFYMIEFLLRAERDGMKICDLPVTWVEDYDTTVNIPKTIKNYLVNICRLKRAFVHEGRENRGHAEQN